MNTRQNTDTKPVTGNKMGTKPVFPLLLNISFPMMISMLVQALYNVVDSMFVSQWNEMAFNGLTVAFSMQMFMIAVATGTGVGMNSLLSKSLGEKNYDRANETARTGIFLAAMSSLFFVLVALFFARSFLRLQVNDPQIVEYGTQYLLIVMSFSLGHFWAITFERLLQSTGKTVLSMIAQLSGAIVNLILDPLLIFGYFFFPSLGVRGAAIATVIGQMTSAVVAILMNLKFNHEIRISFRGFRPNQTIIKTIYKVGIPSIIMQAMTSVTVFFVNRLLYGFETAAVTAYGYFVKLQNFIYMPTFGLTNGMIPIIAYNYGAKQKKRIHSTMLYGVLVSCVMMAIGILLFRFQTDMLLQFFKPSARAAVVATIALQTLCFSFLFAGYNITLSASFQALGNGVYSLLITAVRQFVFVLPIAYLLGALNGMNAVWWAFPISECASMIVATLLLRRINREKLQNLEGGIQHAS